MQDLAMQEQMCALPIQQSNPPSVTAVMAVYNGDAYLPAALAHLADALALGFQVVIVDDGSVDDTWGSISSFCARHDSAVCLRNINQVGASGSRNRALASVQTRFVLFIDVDDEPNFGAIAESALVAGRLSADVMVANARIIGARGEYADSINDAPTFRIMTGAEAFTLLLYGDIQGHLWNKLFRTALLRRVEGPIFPDTLAHSDLGGCLVVFPTADRVVLWPLDVYLYVIRPGSLLQGSRYRWQDLPDCLTLARRSSDELQLGTDYRALRYFSMVQVAIPVFNEITRRGVNDDASAFVRQHLGTRESVLLCRQSCRHGAQGLVIRWLPSTYRWIYRAYRRRRWAQLDMDA